MGGILVGLGRLRICHVVEHSAKEAVHAHAEENCVGVLVAEGGDHVGDVRVPADDAVLPEFGDRCALGYGSGASVDRRDVQDDEVAGAALIELFFWVKRRARFVIVRFFGEASVPFQLCLNMCRRFSILDWNISCPRYRCR